MDKFNREMLSLARDYRGFTQAELEAESGVSQSLISKAEHGLLDPSDDALQRLAKALHFPERFFLEPGRRVGLPHFHAKQRARVPAKTLARIEAFINIRRRHVAKLARSYEIAAPKPIPQIDIDETGLTPERVAARLREYWLLPRGPVTSVTEIIEEAGGVVILSRFGTDLLDGLSIRSEGLPPIFFMNRDVSGDRFRFSLARELGHIVMHSIPENDERMEVEAHRFASAFLMPRDDVRPYFMDSKLSTFAKIKAFWKVPIRELIDRSHDLELMTDYQHKSLMTQYNKTCREAEPVDVPLEVPTTVRKMVRFHLEKLGYSVGELASLLCVEEEQLKQAYLDKPRLRLVASNDDA